MGGREEEREEWGRRPRRKEGEATLVRSLAPASPNGPPVPTQSKLILFSTKAEAPL